jgi:hypothetical protein
LPLQAHTALSDAPVGLGLPERGETMRFKSKIDVPVSILIWGTVLVVLAAAFMAPRGARAAAYPISLCVIFILVWIYFGTYYELREDHLLCRSGPFRERIPYGNIRSVKPSRNLFSSMALSSQRIEIKQRGRGFFTGTTYISPVDRERFIELLKSRCDDLEPQRGRDRNTEQNK